MIPDEMRKELNVIRGVLVKRSPFIMSLLGRCRIVLDPKIEQVCVNSAQEMRINPAFFAQLNPKARMALYAEQALHIALQHGKRMRGKDEQLFNTAACCAVHSMLEAHELLKNAEFPKDFVLITPDLIARITGQDRDKIAKMTAEEIYRLLKKLHCEQACPNACDLSLDMSIGGENAAKDAQSNDRGAKPRAGKGAKQNQEDEEVLQEGDPSAYEGERSEQERAAYWEKAVQQALLRAKQAGTVPEGMEREVGELFKPRVPWLSQLNQCLSDGFGKTFVSTWKRPSRKHPLVPGQKQLTIPTIWNLIDSSGSIGKEEITLELSIVRQHCSLAEKVMIIPWDATAYSAISIRNAQELIRKIPDVKGGGGTVIGPALSMLEEKMRMGDIVIILTDGSITDIDNAEVQKELLRIGRKAGYAIFASNGVMPELPRSWRKIVIE